MQKNKGPEPMQIHTKQTDGLHPKPHSTPHARKKRGKLFNIMPRTIIVFFCRHTEGPREKKSYNMHYV